MKCYHHPEVDAVADCRICGHSLCAGCAVEIRGGSYCRECLAARLESSPLSAAPEFTSPRTAGWLSVVPGLGLVYLGQYVKALVVWLIFIGVIQISEHTDIGGPLGMFWWFAQLLYTVQEARRINQQRAGKAVVVEQAAPPDTASPLWGGLLVGIGCLFLLDQFDLIRFGELFEKLWPVLIIALGLQILLRARKSGAGAAQP